MCWYDSNRAGMCRAAQGKYFCDKASLPCGERQQVAKSGKFKKSDKLQISVLSNLRFPAFQNRNVEMETFVLLGTSSKLEEVRKKAHHTI
jgi:hypothetical protein